MSHQTATALTPLPAESVGCDVLDQALLDGVVLEIAEVHLRMGLVYHLKLGELLLARFFGGDVSQYDACGRRHVSFRALARRQDLPVSHVTLFNAIKVYRQHAVLPESCRDRLPMAHHKALLPLRDERVRAELAALAVEEGMPVVELKRLVAQRRAAASRHERRGRPRLLAMQKTLRWVERTLGDHQNLHDRERAGELSTEELQVLASAADVGLRTLEEVRLQIRTTLNERGIPS